MTKNNLKPIILCSVNTNDGYGNVGEHLKTFKLILQMKEKAVVSDFPFEIEGIIAWEHDTWILNQENLNHWFKKASNRMIRSIPKTDLSFVFNNAEQVLFSKREIMQRVMFTKMNTIHAFENQFINLLKKTHHVAIFPDLDNIEEFKSSYIDEKMSKEDWVNQIEILGEQNKLEEILPKASNENKKSNPKI